MLDSIQSKSTWFFIIFFMLIAFLLFFHLDVRTLHQWDESRLAINTANMFRTGNYLFTMYEKMPDFWNTKPHILILLQTFSSKLFGLTEGSIRLPSAVAAYFSSILIYFWLKKENYHSLFACLSVLAFLCTKFLCSHGARNGDYEALLIFWEISYCYSFFYYIKTHQLTWMGLGFITLILAVLTKGIAGIFFIPGIAIFILLKKKMMLFLKNPFFYFGIFFFIFCVAGYYYIHELLTPGYLKSVYLNELQGRYFKVNEGHNGTLWFYFRTFYLTAFYFFPIWLIGIINLFLDKTIISRNSFLQYILILSCTFFIIISIGQTKLKWYSYPLYPFLGISVAILSHEITKKINASWKKIWLKIIIIWMLMAYIAAIIAIFASLRENHDMEFFIKNNLKNLIPHDYQLIIDDPSQYNAVLDFQIEKFSVQTHYRLKKILLDNIHLGDWIIIKNSQINKINFNLETLYYSPSDNYSIYKIKEKKWN